MTAEGDVTVLAWADFTTALRALEQARVVDFVRFVGRRLEESPAMNAEQFRATWARLLVEYVEMATRDEPECEDD